MLGGAAGGARIDDHLPPSSAYTTYTSIRLVAVVAVIVVVLFVIYSYFSFPNAYELVVYPDIRRIGWTRLHSRTEINICAEYREKAINRNCEK